MVLLVATISSLLVARRMSGPRRGERAARSSQAEAAARAGRAEPLHRPDRPGRRRPPPVRPSPRPAACWTCAARGRASRTAAAGSGPTSTSGVTPSSGPCRCPSSPATQAVAVSPDGRLLAVGCSSPFSLSRGEYPPVPAYLISLPEGRVRHELNGHLRFVLTVAFRPDGRRLATFGEEGTIRVWDTGSGQEAQDDQPGPRIGAARRGAELEPGRPAARERCGGRPPPDLGSRDRA